MKLAEFIGFTTPLLKLKIGILLHSEGDILPHAGLESVSTEVMPKGINTKHVNHLAIEITGHCYQVLYFVTSLKDIISDGKFKFYIFLN